MNPCHLLIRVFGWGTMANLPSSPILYFFLFRKWFSFFFCAFGFVHIPGVGPLVPVTGHILIVTTDWALRPHLTCPLYNLSICFPSIHMFPIFHLIFFFFFSLFFLFFSTTYSASLASPALFTNFQFASPPPTCFLFFTLFFSSFFSFLFYHWLLFRFIIFLFFFLIFSTID